MKRLISILMLLALVTGSISAQTMKSYKGQMNIPPDLYLINSLEPKSTSEIIGNYDYYENEDGERIKHGNFALTFVTQKFNREIKGLYEHGKKTGTWTVKDIKTFTPTNYAKHLELTFNFSDDFLDGTLSGEIQKSPLIYTVSCSFSKGGMTGQYHIDVIDKWEEGISYEINGQIGEDGLPAGIWVFKQKGGIEITQKRLYMNGSLVYIQEYDASSGAKTLPFCAFEGITKAPDATQIVSESISEKDCIKYNDKIAYRKNVSISDHYTPRAYRVVDNCRLPKIGILWISELIEILPDSFWRYVSDDIWDGPEPLAEQRNKWTGYYSR